MMMMIYLNCNLWMQLSNKNIINNSFLAKNIDEFLNYSRTVFEKDGISKKITANAYKSYKINFSPDNSLKKFSEFINE